MLSRSRNAYIKDKYRGCLVGALIGDCLGSVFECEYLLPIDKSIVNDQVGLDCIKNNNYEAKIFEYTDDSAMTFSVAKSLIDNKGYHALDLITKFTERFKKDENRGYGAGMFTIFEKWKKEKKYTKDVWLAAKEQFNGCGSYGNGAAMRISPVSLFGKSSDDVIKLAKENSLLTHSHCHGYNGAILQALAAYKLIETNAAEGIDTKTFIRDLIDTMKDVESTNPPVTIEADDKTSDDLKWSRKPNFSFVNQLNIILELMTNKVEQDNQLNIVETLGNDVSAQEAVPAALYSFLHNASGSFSDVILYAITLGGDTDTIASMAGALAGAFMGYSAIPKHWVDICEDYDVMLAYADGLFELRTEN